MMAAKMVMAPLPNIEPVSLIIMLMGPLFGLRALMAVYVYVFLEATVFGFGLWWISYLYVWPLCLVLSILFRNIKDVLGWAVLAGGFGLMFGALCALVYLPIGGIPLFFSTVVAGIPFDLLHCAGNFAMMLLLRTPCMRALTLAAGTDTSPDSLNR